jgi:hypothetical protein
MKPSQLVQAILEIDGVETVQHLEHSEVPQEGFTLLPFLCPFRYKPYNVVKNEQGAILGVTTGYRDGITKGSKEKIERVESFCDAASPILGASKIRFIMGDSDIYACSSLFPKAPELPFVEGFDVISNKEIWERHNAILELEQICDFSYEKYSSSIQDVIKKERDEHLNVDGGMYHEEVPTVWKERMIRRIISSYMLDGVLMRRGLYGPNPVILGVESLSTTIIQNAALDENEKIPVIMLKA